MQVSRSCRRARRSDRCSSLSRRRPAAGVWAVPAREQHPRLRRPGACQALDCRTGATCWPWHVPTPAPRARPLAQQFKCGVRLTCAAWLQFGRLASTSAPTAPRSKSFTGSATASHPPSPSCARHVCSALLLSALLPPPPASALLPPYSCALGAPCVFKIPSHSVSITFECEWNIKSALVTA